MSRLRERPGALDVALSVHPLDTVRPPGHGPGGGDPLVGCPAEEAGPPVGPSGASSVHSVKALSRSRRDAVSTTDEQKVLPIEVDDVSNGAAGQVKGGVFGGGGGEEPKCTWVVGLDVPESRRRKRWHCDGGRGKYAPSALAIGHHRGQPERNGADDPEGGRGTGQERRPCRSNRAVGFGWAGWVPEVSTKVLRIPGRCPPAKWPVRWSLAQGGIREGEAERYGGIGSPGGGRRLNPDHRVGLFRLASGPAPPQGQEKEGKMSGPKHEGQGSCG